MSAIIDPTAVDPVDPVDPDVDPVDRGVDPMEAVIAAVEAEPPPDRRYRPHSGPIAAAVEAAAGQSPGGGHRELVRVLVATEGVLGDAAMAEAKAATHWTVHAAAVAVAAWLWSTKNRYERRWHVNFAAWMTKSAANAAMRAARRVPHVGLYVRRVYAARLWREQKRVALSEGAWEPKRIVAFLDARVGVTDAEGSGLGLAAYIDGRNALLNAVEARDVRTLERLLSVFVEKGVRQRALALAARQGATECVACLLAAGVDPNSVDDAKERPLTGACRANHLEAVVLLLKAGADVRAGNDEAVRAASASGHRLLARRLILAGADVTASNAAALSYAVRTRDATMVELLLEAGADANTPWVSWEADDDSDESFSGPLVAYAASCGDVTIVRRLLAAGADVRADNDRALRAALGAHHSYGWEGQTYTVAVLLAAGADVNSYKLSKDDGPLAYAVESGDASMVELLLDAGANAHDDDVARALGDFIMYNSGPRWPDAKKAALSTIVQRLVAAGENVCHDDNAAIRAAYREEELELQDLLLAAGADARASPGLAIRVAAERGDVALLDEILALRDRAVANAASFAKAPQAGRRDDDAWWWEGRPVCTALAMASERGHVAIVDRLLAASTVGTVSVSTSGLQEALAAAARGVCAASSRPAQTCAAHGQRP